MVHCAADLADWRVFALGMRQLFSIDRWHGPADSIFGAHRLDNEIDVRAGIGSTIAAFIAMGGGASVGQYGPLVHFGATTGTYIRQILGNKTIGTDVFIGCGVAAAIAAGFHAPIAGIVFAHEAVLRHFSFRALTYCYFEHHIILICNGYFWRRTSICVTAVVPICCRWCR